MPNHTIATGRGEKHVECFYTDTEDDGIIISAVMFDGANILDVITDEQLDRIADECAKHHEQWVNDQNEDLAIEKHISKQ